MHFWKYSDYLDQDGEALDIPRGNYIFYGPRGSHKYTAALKMMQRYCKLQKAKSLHITYNKKNYVVLMSDVHFEIDMEQIAIGSKGLWIQLMQHIYDIVILRKDLFGYIICKNFHLVPNDVLDLMYSYVCRQENTKIQYILLTESVCFLPDQLRSVFNVIRFSVVDVVSEKYKATIIKNIEKLIYNYSPARTNDLRNALYDIFIYNWSVNEAILSVVMNFIRRSSCDVSEVCVNTNAVLEMYDDSYRPIFHLERFAMMMAKMVLKG